MSMTRPRGWFVTFEGVDGSGKSTQMRLFAESLRAAGREVVLTAEPGGTRIGTAIRKILLNPENTNLSPAAEMLLYFAARAQNVDEVLLPSIEAGKIVISDRWTDSTFAYQGYGRELGTAPVLALDEIACRGRKPDLTFVIDVELHAGLERARSRNRTEGSLDESRMDEQELDFYARVREGYRALVRMEPERVRIIDGDGAPEEVAVRVLQGWRSFEAAHV